MRVRSLVANGLGPVIDEEYSGHEGLRWIGFAKVTMPHPRTLSQEVFEITTVSSIPFLITLIYILY